MEEETREGVVIEWSAQELRKHKQSREWYWYIGIVAIGLIVISIVVGNYLAVVIIVLSVFVIFLNSVRPLEELNIKVSGRGVQIDNRFYPYHHLDSFWIREDDHALIVQSQKKLMPHMLFPLGDIDVDELRTLLSHFIKEEPFEKTGMEKILEYLGL